MKISLKSIVLFLLIICLIVIEFLTLMLLGPVKMTQNLEGTAPLAHFLTMNIFYIRIILLVLIFWLSIHYFKKPKRYPKILISIAMVLFLAIYYMANFKLKADQMFSDLNHVDTAAPGDNKVPLDEDIIGVVINGNAKAYPLDYLAYHHKVADSIGKAPIIATYCIWCRSGRVFSSVIDGKREDFRLVGMTEYNAIVEDQSSKTWWQQATGEAIAGEKKGAFLEEIESEQMLLSKWIEKYPHTEILQPDTTFNDMYEHNSKFVARFNKADSVVTDPWERMSWVIGVKQNDESLAFDYSSLIDKRVLQDRIGEMPVAVVLESDTITFHAWEARVDTLELTFYYIESPETLTDEETNSIWDMSGSCISGRLKGAQLKKLQAYEEYWHSWETFHKKTKKVELID